jgi:hypothetical protein
MNQKQETYESRRISCVLAVLLEAAQGGGMSSERAEAIYEDICHHYSRMREGFCPVLAQELRRCLALTDRELDDKSDSMDDPDEEE